MRATYSLHETAFGQNFHFNTVATQWTPERASGQKTDSPTHRFRSFLALYGSSFTYKTLNPHGHGSRTHIGDSLNGFCIDLHQIINNIQRPDLCVTRLKFLVMAANTHTHIHVQILLTHTHVSRERSFLDSKEIDKMSSNHYQRIDKA